MAITRIQNEKPYAMIINRDLNCRFSQWWAEDTENLEGFALDELLETNNLYQLKNELTNIRGEGMSCIDLIITDQPNLFVDSGVHPSLDEHCQHRIIYGKLNTSFPYPPTYMRMVWDYTKANARKIRDTINSVDCKSEFSELNPESMANSFTEKLVSTIRVNIPNKIIKVSDKDPPWMPSAIKAAIQRKR